jgi:hypothetical protein
MNKFLMAIPALLLSASVFAQSGTRLYGGVEYGASKLDDNAQDTANAFVSILGGSAIVTQETSIGVGRLFLGYRTTEQTAVEFGYFASGKASSRVAGVAGGGGAYTATGDVEFDGFDVSGVWFPMAAKFGDSGLFLKAGLHSSEIDAKFSITGAGGTVSATTNYSGTGSLFGAGYDWKYSDQAFVRFAATRYMKIGGESDSDGTVYSIGIGANF